MLIGWSLGGVIGPIIISTLLGGGGEPNYTLAYTVMGIIGLAAVALTFITKVPRDRKASVEHSSATA
jgi:MFS transporter, OFA family, oxalate/formate antiporter